MTLSRARVQEILELIRSTKTDAVQFSDYFSEIVAHDAALRERVQALEREVNRLLDEKMFNTNNRVG